ncbi:helix-turn-helix domain protein [Peptococcaceae bacterium CEB3]|nr:helix-turn-helix domain protein [Peptococcaceae bacterium CEB3]
MRIGEEIRKARIKKGLTQIELAERADVAQGRLSMIENDKYLDMSPEGLASILGALGISYAEIAARAQEADERVTILDVISGKLDKVIQVLFAGNGRMIETRPKLINQLGDATLLPVEFAPLLTVELLEPVGQYNTGDVMFFAPIKNNAEIHENDYLAAETEAGLPVVFPASDRDQYPRPIGRAIRVLVKIG